MSDPFVARQLVVIGAAILGIGFVGCAARRDGASFVLSIGLVVQGLVLVAVGLIGPMADRDQMLFLLIVAGGALQGLVAGLIGERSRDRQSTRLDDEDTTEDKRAEWPVEPPRDGEPKVVLIGEARRTAPDLEGAGE